MILKFSTNISGKVKILPDGSLLKTALIATEGDYEDSSSKKHSFNAEKLKKIFQRTRAWINTQTKNGFIPLLDDHKVKHGSILGKVFNNFILRPVCKSDITDPIHTNLIGKMGLFNEGIKIECPNMIKKILKNPKKSIFVSMGLDNADSAIKEVSITDEPAIPGMSLFGKKDNTFGLRFFNKPNVPRMNPEQMQMSQQMQLSQQLPMSELNQPINFNYYQDNKSSPSLTWDEMDSEKQQDNFIKEKFMEESEKLLKLIENNISLKRERIMGIDAEKNIEYNFEIFKKRIYYLMGLDQTQTGLSNKMNNQNENYLAQNINNPNSSTTMFQ